MRKFRTAVAFALIAALALVVGQGAQAQTPSSSTIKDALKPKPAEGATRGLTRSLTGAPQAAPAQSAEEKQFINQLRTRAITRAISVEEREKVVEIVKDKPKIDLEITFDYNSWTINAKAVPVLVSLGQALSDPDLKGTVFLVGGHTDAKGGDAYNLELSQKRAHAVRTWLSENFKIPADTLVAVGFGKEQIKLKHDPFAEANRRVQVVNLAK
jgi:outer membrane protein OmpA-like peptidoglycan-associated protein